jgi:hypothetical protein
MAVQEQERIGMSAIKNFLRTLAQAFGISTPQQGKPRRAGVPGSAKTNPTIKRD